MSTYEQLRGARLKFLDQDPANASDGQVWYNSAKGKDRVQGVGLASVSSGGALNTGRYAIGSAGTDTAGLVFGGDLFPSPDRGSNSTEEYNFTSWTSETNTPTNRRWRAGAGTATAAIASAGTNPSSSYVTDTIKYDGSSWTSGTAVPTAAEGSNQCGTQTASIWGGGGISPGPYPSSFWNGDGSSWTSITSANNDKRYGATFVGTQTAALLVGGGSPNIAKNESWNGTAWTNLTDLPQANYNSATNIGTQTAATVAGGSPDGDQITQWNGSAWASQPNLSTSRAGRAGSGGSNTSFFICGGPPKLTATEEFTFGTTTTTPAAWASGNAYPATALQLGGSGTQTAGLGFGGTGPGGNPNGLNTTAEYDGASWTAGGNLNNGKATAARNGVGTQTATMSINLRNDGVATPDFPIPPANHNYRALDNVEEYNGSSWSNGTSTPDGGKIESGTCGTTSAALRFGGAPGNPPAGSGVNSTIYWNDSSWTSLNNMSTARYGLASAFQGAYTAALAFGGYTTTNVTTTEEFDGTNWTSGGSLNTAISRHMGSGTQSAALSFGGPPGITRTEGYDGTAWSTRPNMGTGRHFSGAAGSSTAALCIAGDSSTNVEEFTGETTTANPAQSLTTSS